MQDILIVKRNEAVTALTLNRPHKLNALNAELTERLIEAVERASGDGSRLLVFSGTGKGFSGGFDFSVLDSESDADLTHRFVRLEMLLQAVYHAPIATLALAHGSCYGAAADLVCACHRRVAAPGTRFRMPGLAFGVVLGTRRLYSTLGAEAARDVLGRSRVFDAEEAHRIGLITQVSEREEWPAIVAESAEAAQTLDRDAQRTLLQTTVADTRDADLAALVRSVSPPGVKQRIQQYLEKSMRGTSPHPQNIRPDGGRDGTNS